MDQAVGLDGRAGIALDGTAERIIAVDVVLQRRQRCAGARGRGDAANGELQNLRDAPDFCQAT
jgi:hypothetical protein